MIRTIIDNNKKISLFALEYFEIPKNNIINKNNKLEISLVFFRKLINCTIIPIVYAMTKESTYYLEYMFSHSFNSELRI